MERNNEKKVCNPCGKTFTKTEADSFYWDSKIQQIFLYFGYGSKHDMEKWEFCMCEECIENFVKTFKIPIVIKNVDALGREVNILCD
jgi:hypothetical protein